MRTLAMMVATLGLVASLYAEVDKLYLEPEQVWIEKNNICIHLLGSLFPVNGIYTDGRGIYVLANELIDQNTFNNTCPLGHFSPDGSGMCRKEGCLFQKKK